jgi:hypothetical protein
MSTNTERKDAKYFRNEYYLNKSKDERLVMASLQAIDRVKRRELEKLARKKKTMSIAQLEILRQKEAIAKAAARKLAAEKNAYMDRVVSMACLF